MSEAIIVALVMAAGSIIAQVIVSNKTTSDLMSKLDKQSEIADKELDKRIAVYAAGTDQKIEELTRTVREHNNFARRVPVIEEQIKVANHRIDDLEKQNLSQKVY